MVRGAQFLVGHNAFSDRPLHPDIGRILRAWKAILLDCRSFKAREPLPELDFTAPAAGYYGLVSAGCGDGYWRQPGSQVLVEGRRQPVVGLPGFDCTVVRLERAYPAGTEVLLTGAQGDESITIEDLAKWWHTGPGKISSVIPAHVPRLYL
ncbi:MAG: alanine racemase C-terminal domain-containing protein, partial [Anaerolineaceae bacterium]